MAVFSIYFAEFSKLYFRFHFLLPQSNGIISLGCFFYKRMSVANTLYVQYMKIFFCDRDGQLANSLIGGYRYHS